MTPDQKLRGIQAWQTAGHVHELTCGNDSKHQPLVPILLDGEILLYCVDCDYQQEESSIPVVCFQGPPPLPPTLTTTALPSNGDNHGHITYTVAPESEIRGLPNGGKCQNCNEREATEDWVGEGSMMDHIHGFSQRWCKLCCLRAQLEHAKKRAAAIPELEQEIKELEA